MSVINISGTISTDTTWTAGNIYYLTADTTVAAGVTLTIEGGAIVKFWVPYDPNPGNLTGLLVNGYLRFTNTTPDVRVIFTSGRDDTTGGDTNGDGAQTLPAPGDWDYVRLTKWTAGDPSYQFITVRYSYLGLNFHSTTTSVIPEPTFENNVFVENHCGLTFSINSDFTLLGLVQNNSFSQNEFGFCTDRQGGTGQINPTLFSNDFNTNSILPIFLSGTSFPVYDSNRFTGYPDPGDKLGIGLGGQFNTSGTLTIVDGMPFVIVTPVEVIGSGTNLTVPGGAVFKSFTRYQLAKTTDPLFGLKVTASSGITFESDELHPIVFTSYRDDTIGGILTAMASTPNPIQRTGRVYISLTHNCRQPQITLSSGSSSATRLMDSSMKPLRRALVPENRRSSMTLSTITSMVCGSLQNPPAPRHASSRPFSNRLLSGMASFQPLKPKPNQVYLSCWKMWSTDLYR